MSHIKDLSDMAERWGFAKGLLAAARLAIDAGNPQLAVAIVELGNSTKTVEPPPPAPLIPADPENPVVAYFDEIPF